MALRGSSFDAGAKACPFVALELDRDRRSERPDYRHRCYAEQVPAPRTIAHQERFCLSPNFSGCPIFQDWALRAAARPVPLPQGYEGRAVPDPRLSAAAGAAAAADLSGSADEPAPSFLTPEPADPPDPHADEVWPDSMATPLPADGEAGASSEAAGAQQLSAFDAPSQPSLPPLSPEPEPAGSWERAASDHPRSDHTPEQDIDQDGDAAPVPAFLVGRSSRPRASSGAEPHVARDDVVPSWEITDRYGAQSGGEPTGGGGIFGRLLTIAAVVIILGLGVGAVILVPNLLGGSPGSTTRPSLNVPSRGTTPAGSGVSVIPTLTPTVATTSVEPTTAATPEASPRLYRIKAGDTLAKIARKNGITVGDILTANPQIPDANQIQVGQVIVIPLPAATP